MPRSTHRRRACDPEPRACDPELRACDPELQTCDPELALLCRRRRVRLSLVVRRCGD